MLASSAADLYNYVILVLLADIAAFYYALRLLIEIRNDCRAIRHYYTRDELKDRCLNEVDVWTTSDALIADESEGLDNILEDELGPKVYGISTRIGDFVLSSQNK